MTKSYVEEFVEICLKKTATTTNADIKKIKDMPVQQHLHKETIFIEFRVLPHCEHIIRNCLDKLGSDWSHTVVCTKQCSEFYTNMCSRINPNIRIVAIDVLPTHNAYNNLLLTVDFWELFHGEKLLLYQSDSYIFASLAPVFLSYDYIGAPYSLKPHQQQILAPLQVGNGGLSLRSKSVMIATLKCVQLQNQLQPIKYTNNVKRYKKKRGLDHIPEDIVFSQNIQRFALGTIPPYDLALQFCGDSVFHKDVMPFGMHCMWNKYTSKWRAVFQQWTKQL